MPAILMRPAGERAAFWARVGDVYYAVSPMLEVTHWVKGCLCHEDQLVAGKPVDCIWKGCRAPELKDRVGVALQKLVDGAKNHASGAAAGFRDEAASMWKA